MAEEEKAEAPHKPSKEELKHQKEEERRRKIEEIRAKKEAEKREREEARRAKTEEAGGEESPEEETSFGEEPGLGMHEPSKRKITFWAAIIGAIIIGGVLLYMAMQGQLAFP